MRVGAGEFRGLNRQSTDLRRKSLVVAVDLLAWGPPGATLLGLYSREKEEPERDNTPPGAPELHADFQDNKLNADRNGLVRAGFVEKYHSTLGDIRFLRSLKEGFEAPR